MIIFITEEKMILHQFFRALTPLLGNGIGKISVGLTKIGKIYIVSMYEVSIARLIPKVNLTLFLLVVGSANKETAE